MAKDPAFLFYTKDFQSGTNYMSCEEVGAYLRLLMHQHQHGSIPCDEEKLMRITGIFSKEKFDLVWNEIKNKFTVVNQMVNQMVNQRLNQTMDERAEFRPKKIASAVLAGLLSANRELDDNQRKMIKKSFKIDDFIFLEDEKMKEEIRVWFLDIKNKMVNQMVNNIVNVNVNANGDVNANANANGDLNNNIINSEKFKKNEIELEIDEVLEHFVKITGRNISVENENNRKFVRKRLKEKIPKDDLKKIIELKNFSWKDDLKMRSYIRIETLFNETKCNSYLAEIRDLETNPELLKKTIENVKFNQTGQRITSMEVYKQQLYKDLQ